MKLESWYTGFSSHMLYAPVQIDLCSYIAPVKKLRNYKTNSREIRSLCTIASIAHRRGYISRRFLTSVLVLRRRHSVLRNGRRICQKMPRAWEGCTSSRRVAGRRSFRVAFASRDSHLFTSGLVYHGRNYGSPSQSEIHTFFPSSRDVSPALLFRFSSGSPMIPKRSHERAARDRKICPVNMRIQSSEIHLLWCKWWLRERARFDFFYSASKFRRFRIENAYLLLRE